MNYEYDNTNITDKEVVKRVKIAVKLDVEKKKAMNAPIAVYEPETGNVYALYNDGRKVLMGTRIKRGGYSEHANDEA